MRDDQSFEILPIGESIIGVATHPGQAVGFVSAVTISLEGGMGWANYKVSDSWHGRWTGRPLDPSDDDEEPRPEPTPSPTDEPPPTQPPPTEDPAPETTPSPSPPGPTPTSPPHPTPTPNPSGTPTPGQTEPAPSPSSSNPLLDPSPSPSDSMPVPSPSSTVPALVDTADPAVAPPEDDLRLPETGTSARFVFAAGLTITAGVALVSVPALVRRGCARRSASTKATRSSDQA
jgi:hypothetical protein